MTPASGKLKVCAIADLHGYLPGFMAPADLPESDPFVIEPCDLLLVAGDICPVFDHSLENQFNFINGPFREWLNRIPAKQVVGVAGNHDWIFQLAPDTVPKDLRWTYLLDEELGVHGLNLYGTPHQPTFGDLAFNLPERALRKKWEKIPTETDILILHGPPLGYGDCTSLGVVTGSPSLRKRIEKIKPTLTVFGHIHEGHGRWTRPWGTLANVTLRDASYSIVNAPTYFELGHELRNG